LKTLLLLLLLLLLPLLVLRPKNIFCFECVDGLLFVGRH